MYDLPNANDSLKLQVEISNYSFIFARIFSDKKTSFPVSDIKANYDFMHRHVKKHFINFLTVSHMRSRKLINTIFELML